MKIYRKVVSASLATLIILANLSQVLASSTENPVITGPIQLEVKPNQSQDDLPNPEGFEDKVSKDKSLLKGFDKDKARPQKIIDRQEKPIYKNLRVKVKLFGLENKEFENDLDKTYQLDFTYKDKNTNSFKSVSRNFTKDGSILDFGIIPQEAIENGVLSLKKDSDDEFKLIEDYSLEDLENQDFLIYKIYQVQSTKLSVRTFTSDGRLTSNPTDLHFSYRLFDKIKKGRIPFDSEEIDVFEDETYTFDLEDGENIYDGRKEPEISLDMAENGYVSLGDYAYKILKQEQKDEESEIDRSQPLKVTLIKKAKLIKSVDQPTYTDPDTGEEILDDDYVRRFDKNAQDEEIPSNYWILKTDKDLIPEENDGEKEKTENKEGFLANDISICAGDAIFTDILLKKPSESQSPITKAILKKDDLENGKLIFGGNDEIEVEIVDFSYLEDIDSYSVSLRVAVDPSYGKKVRKSDQILRDEADPLNPVPYINQLYQISLVDENGNSYIFENQIIIKNQNTKADLKPEKIQLEKGGIIADTKQKIRPQDIIDKVKNGRWQNKKSANESYANRAMAIKKAPSFLANSIEPKLAADPFILDEDKFDQIDWNEPGVYEVPVIVAWIDGSTSRVNVPVEVLANDIVMTGIFDTDYGLGLVIASMGLLAGAISLYNLNRKKAYF